MIDGYGDDEKNEVENVLHHLFFFIFTCILVCCCCCWMKNFDFETDDDGFSPIFLKKSLKPFFSP